MKKIIIAFATIFCFFSHARVVSQNIIPPSPEASNIARYADIPVSLYTGKPQIEFPLYTLKCGSIELPISLSYYASGIRVEDYPTWAGIGWALNAGGVIGRTIRGPSWGTGGNNLGQYLPISYPTIDDFYNLVNLGDGYHNTESDIFHYNFCEFAGSFQIKNNAPVFQKYASLKIEFPIDLSAITITDDKGNKYYFEPVIASGIIGTDYYLKRIESVNKSDNIYFDYVQGDSYIRPPHNSDFYSLKNTVNKIGTTGQISEGAYSGKLLRKIYTSNNDSVVFIRKDILQPGYSSSYDTHRQALDYITVYNSISKLFSYHLKVNNIQSINPYSKYLTSYPALNTTTDMNYRLYLDGFDEIDVSGNIIMSYGFDYYGRTNDGRDSLANRYSFAQDLGGFYNGQNNNNSLIPSFNQTIYPSSDLEGRDGFDCVDFNNYVSNVSISGANRSSNLQYMRMGTLKSIKYPTGGYAKFYFSQIDNPANLNEPLWGLKVDKIEYLDVDGSLQKRKKYSYSDPVFGYPLPSYWHYTFFNLGTNQTNPYPYCDCNFPCSKDWGWAMELSPNNVYDLGMNDGPLVGYGGVSEIEDGNGRTDYTYSIVGACGDDYPNYYFVVDGLAYDYDQQPPHSYRYEIANTWPLGPIPNNNWELGTLISKKIYSEDNSLKQETDYYYSHPVLDVVPGIKIFQYKQDFFYLYYQFNYSGIWEKLDSVAEILDGISKVTRYDYNGYKQVNQTETKISDGTLLTTKLRYPSDINSGVYASMKNLNMINYPIEVVSLKNNYVTESTLNIYKVNGSSYVPDKVYKTECTSPFSGTSFTYFNGTTKDGHYSTTPEITFDYYDSKGNVTQATERNGIATSYLWDATKTYLMAQVKGTTYSTISSQNGKTFNYNSKTLWTSLNSLASSALIDTYSYSPLIGISSQTNPMGTTTNYEYDTLGRLIFIRNDDTDITNRYTYHYKQ